MNPSSSIFAQFSQPAFSVAQARFNMIEQQIRPCNVLDSQVLALLAQTQREHFVPIALASLAFSDTELPLGHGQTMLTPKLEAQLLQAAAVKVDDRVLEIGTGSGYMAALIGFTAAQVCSFEIVSDLAVQAQAQLHTALLDNVRVMQGCGFVGGVTQAGERGWDLIMLSGSVPNLTTLPQTLLNTLTLGGRLVAVVGDATHSPMMQAVLLTRKDENNFVSRILFDCNAPALSGVVSSLFKF